MRNFKCGWAIMLALILLLTGCAHRGTFTAGTYNAPDGTVFDEQVTTSPGPWDMDGKKMVTYNTRSWFNPISKHWEPLTTLVDSKAGFVDGLGKQLTVAAVKAIIESGGWIAGAYLFNSAGQAVASITNTVSQSQNQKQKLEGNVIINPVPIK